jgi:hypothetical protein
MLRYARAYYSEPTGGIEFNEEIRQLIWTLLRHRRRQPGRSADRCRLAASLEEFTGHPAYGIVQLRGDLERFVFLLGGSHGESLFGATVGE